MEEGLKREVSGTIQIWDILEDAAADTDETLLDQLATNYNAIADALKVARDAMMETS